MGLRAKMGPFRYWPATAAAALEGGDVQLFGSSIAGVATQNAASGDLVDLAVEGTFEADKDEGFACNPGDVARYDISEKKLVSDATTDTVDLGVCIETAGVSDLFCLIALDWDLSDAPDPSSSSA